MGRKIKDIDSKTRKLIVSLYNKENSLSEISKKIGIGRTRIFYILRKEGVKLRNTSESGKIAFKKKNTQKPNWTEEQIDILKREFPRRNTKKLVGMINKSYCSINYEAKKLGLVKNAEWTDKEIKLLKKEYPNKMNKDLSEEMGRDICNISTKAHRLNLKKSKEFWEDESKRISDRMKLNNPMKREEVAIKCGKTMKDKYESGELVNYWKGKKMPHLTKRNLENNPMNNPESVEKSRQKQIENHKSGKVKAWCEGMNKEEFKKHFPNGKIWNEGKTHLEDFRINHGENVNTFNNWSSFEPYGIEFNKYLKRHIKERDGCCMICNIGFEDLKLLKRKIHIHHINYDKRCNLKQNLLVLCISCHSKTNVNRFYWTKFFQSLLSERYGYKYSENQEIILEIKNEI